MICGDMYTQTHIGVYLSCLLAIERIENEHPDKAVFKLTIYLVAWL